jgi:tetratricopeptide (TPR) repeat protein
MVYYQQWDDIFNAQKPLAQHSYATLLWHFARGMAFTEKNNLAAAENEIEAVRNLMKEDHMKVRNGSFNTPEDATTVALNILMGLKADKENKPEEAFSYLKKAVETEDAMVYDEPKDWLIPARSYLGYTYLKHRHFNEAATVFKQSLKKDPGEPKALKGLQLAKMKQSL